jgi:hypothetical protein
LYLLKIFKRLSIADWVIQWIEDQLVMFDNMFVIIFPQYQITYTHLLRNDDSFNEYVIFAYE